ncbi:MAG: LysM peptidoglycan-binding domain-containing protein [Bacteroidales bacterium]|nr:LysM peptidoglycan-binding domain-containing protein [Bacteroidales bacterium]MCB9012872.1 LysM peptidoglycan-binding domain-containing protein [Bacteroidales bacterium]
MQPYNNFRLFILTGIFLVSYIIGSAQVTITKSENKVVIEGQVYFLHVVKAGQTLYSISKAYNVSENQIVKDNPGADKGLQIGQMLKISAKPGPEPVKLIVAQPQDTTYLQHVVKQGETMYSIARAYNMTVSDLQDLNPQVVNNELSIGQVILIPRNTQTEINEEFTNHKVKRKETVYGISRMYGISEDMLKQYNPELLERSPKTGQILKIPSQKMIQALDSRIETVGKDTLQFFDMQSYDTVQIASNYAFYLDSLPRIQGRTFNVAYLIPFNYHPPEQVMPADVENVLNDDVSSTSQGYNPDDQMLDSRNFLEFMEGSMLAIDSLKNEGISVNVFFFDTKKSPTRVRQILSSRDFNKMDLIIGPFYSFNIEIVSEFSLEHRIPMISPLSGEMNSLEKNPYLFQLNPGYRTEYDCIADYSAGMKGSNIVVIRALDSLNLYKYNYLKEKLVRRLNMLNPSDSTTFSEIVYDYASKMNLLGNLQNTLSSTRPNLVIVPETDEAFVTTVVTQLYFQLKNYNISVIGMPHWSTFQNIDFLYFHKLGLSYFTPYYFSYDSSDVKHFLRDYRNTFYAEPVTMSKKGGSYAFLGYDLSYYFLKSIDTYGKRFILHLNESFGLELMNDFRFEPVGGAGGFENHSLMLVKYLPNLEIKANPYIIKIPLPVLESQPDSLEIVPTDLENNLLLQDDADVQ